MWTLARNVQNMSPFITGCYIGVLARMPGVGPKNFARIIRAVQLSVKDFMPEVATNVVEGLAGWGCLPRFYQHASRSQEMYLSPLNKLGTDSG